MDGRTWTGLPGGGGALRSRGLGLGPGLVAGLLGGLLLGLLLSVGCANPGPPLPPSLRLPEKATKLEAVRVAGEVRVSFTVPLTTTDGQRNGTGLEAVICRGVAAKGCVEVGRVAVLPGEATYVDVLPESLRTGSPVLLGYAVQVVNARGRSAGNGERVYAPAGAAPPAVSGLAVSARRGAVLIRWQPEGTVAEMEVTRRAATAAVKPERKAARGGVGLSGLSGGRGGPAKEESLVRLSGGDAPDRGGMVDSGVRDGEEYVYTAQRVQRVLLAGHALELRGAESAAVTIAYRDVFPPAAPTGLVAVAGGGGGRTPAIDLVWDASAEDGVTGYTVYRREGGAFQRLAVTAVAAYRDAGVTPGVRYTYRVTATDTHGNESAPSAEINETVRP